MEQTWKITNHIDYHCYKINETNVFIGKRPDLGFNSDFYNSIDGFISVTESYYQFPLNKPQQWFPWKETMENFPDTVLFGTLKVLNYWINVLKLKNIYLHCDAGTHRAPSVLGAFLDTYYREEQDRIVKNVKTPDKTYYISPEGELRSNPIQYFLHKKTTDPTLEYLAQFIKDYPEADLEGCVKGYRSKLPYKLMSIKEKKEFNKNKKIQSFKSQIKKIIEKKGYVFNSPYDEFEAILEEKKISVWICAVPWESYHGILGVDIKKGPIHIISPLKANQFNLEKYRDTEAEKYYDVEYKYYKKFQLAIITLKN